MKRGPRAARRLSVVLVLAIAMLLAFATPAMALINPKVTLDEEAGGYPTRFTFVAITDKDASISGMDFTFPAGFDLTKVRFDTVTLEGLVRTPIVVSGSPTGETLSLRFVPSVAASSTLRVQIHDVVPTNQGGTYKLKVAYSAESTATGSPVISQRTDDTMEFSYRNPSVAEMTARSLDANPAVTQWNSVKALGMFFKPQLIVTSIPLVITGWFLALTWIAFGFPIAIVGGLGLAFMKMSKIPPLRWISAAYVNVIRGTPLFLQIFVAFIGLRIAGFRVDDNITAVAVLAINSSAYLAEIFRAGIQSISKGQFEAASSLGMNYAQAMQYVIIPQTVKRVLPTMTSEFILLFKDTALFASVGRPELMFAAQNIVANTGNMTPFVVIAVFYLIITIPLINFVGRLEAKLAVSEHGQAPTDKPKRRGGFMRALAISNDPYRAMAPEAIPDENARR
jgi:polar amino acid transport system substrate-binding protein